MKLRSLLAVVAISALTLVASLPAQAQGGGGGGFGGGGGGQRRGGGRMGPQTPWNLVSRPDVQKDIMVTDDEKTKLEAAQTDMRAKQREMFQNGGGAGGDRTAMMAAMQKMQEDYATTIKGILTPTQQDRLLQIFIQLNGTSSITNADVQKKLMLSSDTVAKIKALQDAQMKANADIRAKVQSGEVQQSDVRGLMQKNNEIMKTELEKVLTDDQKAALKAAGGAPFTADPAPAGGGN